MRTALVLAAALLTSCAAANPQGRANYGPVTGESLITFGGSLSSIDPDQGSSARTTTGQAGFGYFISEEHEVGGQVLLIDSDGSGFEAQNYSIAPYYNYNYRQSSRTWFYGGPHMGLVYSSTKAGNFSDDDTSFSFGVHGGLRQWITPRTSYFLEPRFTTSSEFDDFTFLFGLNFTL